MNRRKGTNLVGTKTDMEISRSCIDQRLLYNAHNARAQLKGGGERRADEYSDMGKSRDQCMALRRTLIELRALLFTIYCTT